VSERVSVQISVREYVYTHLCGSVYERLQRRSESVLIEISFSLSFSLSLSLSIYLSLSLSLSLSHNRTHSLTHPLTFDPPMCRAIAPTRSCGVDMSDDQMCVRESVCDCATCLYHKCIRFLRLDCRHSKILIVCG